MTDLIQHWPTCPPAATLMAKTQHTWLQQLSSAMTTMQTRIRILEDENKSQAIELVSLRTEVNELNKKTTETVTTTANVTFASMIQNNGKKSEADMVSFTKMAQEFKERERIENNVIISGLEESTNDNEEEKSEEDQRKVEAILETLGVNKTKCKRIARMKARRRVETVSEEQATATRPALIIVELKDKESKQVVLTKSRDLGRTTQFKHIYINQDRTLSERALERHLRETKKQRNSQLPEEITENGVTLRYKIENGKRWFWGIRNGNVVWVLHKDDRDN
ncbi:hypothetical protein BpHYR1_002801 [Brachionus plicatilis]|uniref:Uncharacterized protein n=1 Tax=Brachionus plicatilis TaxID=10195 RepID=A0A3M7PF79_BRAPC|nr:hypothetical protein BpHYR1_002801 [Brachionus plicatilis]